MERFTVAVRGTGASFGLKLQVDKFLLRIRVDSKVANPEEADIAAIGTA